MLCRMKDSLMAHELEQFQDGRTAFVAGNNENAWHRLGTVKADSLTVDDLMTDGLLGGWNVRTEPLFFTETGDRCLECGAGLGSQHEDVCATGDEAEAIALQAAGVGVDEFDGRNQGRNPFRLVVPDDTATPQPMKNWWATVRTNPVTKATEGLGTVQGQYTPIQNEELAEILQALVDEYGAVFDTGGSLRGGREVFMSMKLPEAVMVGGHDAHNLNLVGMNAHDGTRSLYLVITMIRVVCANTQSMALQHFKSKHKIRHVGNVKARIAEAREALGLSFKVAEDFQKEAEKLLMTPMSDEEFKSFCEVIWPQKEVKNTMHAMSKYHERGARLLKLFREAPTQENCRNTRLAAANAFSEWTDHWVDIRTKQDQAVARADRALFGDGAELKDRVFQLLKVG